MRKKRAIKNTILSLIMQLVVLLCGFIVPRLIISQFGSEVNGLLSSITQFLGYIVLLESGIGPVIRASLYKPISEKNESEIVNILYSSEKFFKKISYIFLVYIVLLCFIFPLFVNSQFNTWFTISLIVVISISTFFEYYFGMTYRLFLRANQESYVISYVQIITAILNTICIFVLIKCGLNVQIVKLFSSLIFVLRPVILNVYIKKKYHFNYKIADKNYKLKQKWDGFSQHIAAVIHSNTDIVVLTLFSTLTNVSIYSVYSLVIKGVRNIVDALTNGIDSAFGDMIARKEISKLNQAFKKYETLYFSLVIIAFSCTLFLINPFVSVYTNGIKDANYIQPIFGYIIVLAEYVYAIRLPYNTLCLSAGLFKEMKKGAWIEAISNVVVSIILVYKFGLIGVALGTLFAMIYRTIEFIILASKKILIRNYSVIVKKMSIVVLELLILFIVDRLIVHYFVFDTYYVLIIYAVIIFMISIVILIILSVIFDFQEFKDMLKKIKTSKLHHR